ncbi:unnamed protein product [Linum trigynum]|uniref:Gnk2-homologous domain-containing protein n=1 Tax=Linum trigynum TaxID=586398 RepID=A0AAV2D376_9ROSI
MAPTAIVSIFLLLMIASAEVLVAAEVVDYTWNCYSGVDGRGSMQGIIDDLVATVPGRQGQTYCDEVVSSQMFGFAYCLVADGSVSACRDCLNGAGPFLSQECSTAGAGYVIAKTCFIKVSTDRCRN